MNLMSVEKMKELESNANAGGYSYEKMMVKAGEGLARIVHERYSSQIENHVLGLVGGGNNGGDTLIALAELQKLGWQTAAIMLKEDQSMQPLVIRLHESGGRVTDTQTLEQEVSHADLILDGIFGTGFHPPMQDGFAQILARMTECAHGKVIVAVDCPSGVDCVTGMVSEGTLKANLTISMQAVKEGMLILPAFEYCGDLLTVDLGIPAKFLKAFENNRSVIDAASVKASLPLRGPDSHKGTYGHLIVCGGCVNYPGAPMLSARSAYRIGTGLVECAIPERIFDAVIAANRETIYTLLEDEDGVIAENATTTLAARLKNSTCLLLGPGIGREETTFRFFQKLVGGVNRKTHNKSVGFLSAEMKDNDPEKMEFPPLVLDADALHLLTRIDGWQHHLSGSTVLTPHPGEMSALTGLPVSEIQAVRWKIACEYAQQWNKVVVLKGALTVVASPKGEMAVMPYASSALAKAGTGDVLAGMIGGLIAQGVNSFEAAQAGVWLHAAAAQQVVALQGSEYGLLAGDLIDAVPHALGQLQQKSRR